MGLSGDVRHVLVRVGLLSVIQVEWDAAFLQAMKSSAVGGKTQRRKVQLGSSFQLRTELIEETTDSKIRIRQMVSERRDRSSVKMTDAEAAGGVLIAVWG